MQEQLYTVSIKFAGEKAEVTRNLNDREATKLEREAWKKGAVVVEVFQQK